MLLNLREYHRPHRDAEGQGLDRALGLLARPDVRTVPLAGGDSLLGSGDPAVEAVVDLQALGLDQIRSVSPPAALHIGAMVTRTQLAENGEVRQGHSGIIAEAARRWGGNVQRNQATVGGALALAAPDDALVATLLACDATVLLYDRRSYDEIPLLDFIPRRRELLAAPALIVETIVPLPAILGGGALTSVARTPSDTPIVLAAVTLTVQAGQCADVRIALGGLGDAPVRYPEVETVLVGQALNSQLLSTVAARLGDLVRPTGNLRGSVDYRRAMAAVLTKRALSEAWRRAGQHDA
jgi:CO/xanthine dehydrogenase FAD-binding subunit